MMIKSLRRLLTLLVVLMSVSVVMPSYAANEQTSQQMANAEQSTADMWRAVKAGEVGTTAATEVEAGVLINTFGNEGKIIKNDYINPAMMAVVVGVFSIFLIFFLVNGPSKLTKGFSGKMVLRWSKADVILHWGMAISCFALILTGLTIMLGRHIIQPFIGHEAWAFIIHFCKTVHDWVGPVFFVFWAICVLKWMPRQTFKSYDLKWFLVAGGYINFGPFKGKHPHSGYANAGEKMWFWSLAIFGLFICTTGLMLVFPGLALPREVAMIAVLVHGVSAIVIIGFTIVHIWMATALSEGGLECMKSGYCDENWAIQHHDIWYEEIKANGTLKYQD